jgi:hypothetical protein
MGGDGAGASAVTSHRTWQTGAVIILAGSYPVLSLVSAHVAAGQRVEGIPLALLAAAGVACLAWIASAAITRDDDRRLLLALIGVAWFSAFGTLARALRSVWLDPHAALVPSVLLAGLVAAAIAILAPGSRRHAARLVTLTVLILAFFPGALLLMSAPWSRSPTVPDAPPAPRVYPPDPAAPDIYLIVLDKYSGSRSLRDNHGFDNSAFESALRTRGFIVPERALANYPHTWMSLASMLNWSHIEALADGQPFAQWPTVLAAAIEDNRLLQFLRARGYEYVFVPSTFPATRQSRFADRVVGEPRSRAARVNVFAAWAADTALFPASLWWGSADRPFALSRFPYDVETAADLEQKFQALADLAGDHGPRFVFAHVLVPHEPYVFDAECRHRTPLWPATDYGPGRDAVRRAYLEQISCLNARLLDLIDAIVTRSPAPPVVLLQADHGHGFMGLNPLLGDQPPLGRLETAQVRERLDAFAAYHLPGTSAGTFELPRTLVNLFPSVLNHYFDAGLPFREDRIYWSELHPPYRMEDVSAEVIEGTSSVHQPAATETSPRTSAPERMR